MLGAHAARLRRRLAEPRILIAPGVYDALTAALVEMAGFEAAYLSGASIAYTKLGRPDIALVSAAEVADSLAHVRERIDLPLIVDADTGFGNALNVQRTMRVFERAGASAIQIEDQSMPKRCGHLTGKTLIASAEMVGKIKAALDARIDPNTLVIARTDAVAVEGIDAAIARAHAYAEAGADVLFVEAPKSVAELGSVAAKLRGHALLVNMVEGGATPQLAGAELERLGYRIAIFPGAIVRSVTWAVQRLLKGLRETGTTTGQADRMLDMAGLNEVLETAALLETGRRYDPSIEPGAVDNRSSAIGGENGSPAQADARRSGAAD